MNKRKRLLLCMLEGSGQKSRWISGVPPLSFKASAAGTLENYRIYGNTVGGEGVGDLVGSGEHAGEYKVSVTVEGKNLVNNTATTRQINGVTFTVNSDGSVTCDGTASANAQIVLVVNMYLSSGEYILSGCPIGGSVSTYELSIFGVSDYYANGIRNRGKPVTFSFPVAIQTINVAIIIRAGYTCDNLTFYPMIRKADIEDETYEPYRNPEEIDIYLPAQLEKSASGEDYIDFLAQKMYKAGAETVDVTLPALPVGAGTNVLSVGTAVQPSEIEIKGQIKNL